MLNLKNIREKQFPIVEVLLFIGLIGILFTRINEDFWNDEIYTLYHFTFTSLANTVNDYHVPNNHVLFNFINNLYLRIIQLDSLSLLLEHPWKLRVTPFFYALLAGIFTYKIGIRLVNKWVARYALLFVITSIPFYYFSLQIRGYGLSILLLTILTYFILEQLEKQSKSNFLWIIISSAAAVYTLPFNIYPIIGALLGLLILAVNDYQKQQRVNKNILKIILVICGGLGFALVLFIPIFEDVFFNEYVKPGNGFDAASFLNGGQFIFESLISRRFYVAILSSIGLVLLVVKLNRIAFKLVFLATIILTPFIIVFIRGDNAPSRLYVVVIPLLSIIAAAGINKLVEIIPIKSTLKHTISFVLIGTYCFAIFYRHTTNIKDSTLSDIKELRRSQHIFSNYYNENYQPLKAIQAFKKTFTLNPLPVLIYGCEPHGVSFYLEKEHIPYINGNFQIKAFDSLKNTSNNFYIITNHPFQFDQDSSIFVKQISEELSYHNALLISTLNTQE